MGETSFWDESKPTVYVWFQYHYLMNIQKMPITKLCRYTQGNSIDDFDIDEFGFPSSRILLFDNPPAQKHINSKAI